MLLSSRIESEEEGANREKKKKRKKAFVKPVMKKQPTVVHFTSDKIPKSFVFSRGKLPGSDGIVKVDAFLCCS
ncbi:hypothetical protein RHMOL_Rhmol05G0304800 [Rhododendron molle]|uniref:Uncharacterized protein n=2 Tax=Rhododendron molle TaxID=49168 RepID=A0ACC0NVZ6_RHOML|nr:hypothetical protein RHMOL_Rhmol07G0221500 [Rhododendron molle]KAI8557059.1 hypothetical protein RHMOL_Rhmol05G0304800 [Rhododendron molle]